MEAPTDDRVEIISGLGGAGAEIMLGCITRIPLQAHPMIPLLQASDDAAFKSRYGADLDLLLDDTAPIDAWTEQTLTRIADVASQRYRPKLSSLGATSFQLTRGLLGVSL